MPYVGARTAAWIGALTSAGISTPFLCLLAWFAAPQLESRIPVVRADLLSVTRIADRACWHIRMHKIYAAKFISMDYYVHTMTNSRIPIVVEHVDDSDVPSSPGIQSHGMGDTWETAYCTLITEDIDSPKGVSLEGYGTYLPWHKLYEVSERVLSLTVPPP